MGGTLILTLRVDELNNKKYWALNNSVRLGE